MEWLKALEWWQWGLVCLGSIIGIGILAVGAITILELNKCLFAIRTYYEDQNNATLLRSQESIYEDEALTG